MAKEPNKKSFIVLEVWAILSFLVALFVSITLLNPHTTGWLGEWIVVKGFGHLFGHIVVGMPIFLLSPMLPLFFSSIKPKTSLWVGSLFFVMILIACELLFGTGLDQFFWPVSYEVGGWVGHILATLLVKFVGVSGTWIVLLGGLCGCLVGIFSISFKDILVAGLVFLKKKQSKKAKKNPIKQEVSLALESGLLEEKDEEREITYTPLLPQKDKEIGAVESILSPSGTFELPSSSFLEESRGDNSGDSVALRQKQRENSLILENTLHSFQVRAKVVNVTQGPSVTRYELQPGLGVKISKITSLNRDIALKLSVPDVRIEAPIPGKALIGIEVPNTHVKTIVIRQIVESAAFATHPSRLLCAIGMTISGESVLMDLAKMPHLLIAGATGSGKSVCVNSIILSILMRATPEDVRFLMIDPKKVELSLYEGIPHLVAPVVTNPHHAAATLKQWALLEMERRYEEFSKYGVKDIQGFNALVDPKSDRCPVQKIPYIVVIIDELADLMMVASQDVENTICRLAQMSRATGIHLVIATQRPSVNVITGLIKANIPSRISFFLQSQIDSRTIIDMPGAEKLFGKGDMLYCPVGSGRPERVQGVFVREEEIKRIVTFLKMQQDPEYSQDILNVEPVSVVQSKTNTEIDPLFEEAKQLIIHTRYASTSYLQRKFRIGYNRAARLMDALQEEGLIGEYVGEKKSREVI